MKEQSVTHRGVSIYKRGGRWRFTWRTENRWISSETLPAALAELDRLIDARARTSTRSRIESLSIVGLLDEWWPRKLRELREATQMRYEGVIRLHILPRIGSLAANDIRPMDIEDYYSGVTYKTALVSRDVLRPAFKWGMANRLVLRVDGCSPMDLAKLSRARCVDGNAEADANVTMQVDERLIPKPAELEKLLIDAEERRTWPWWLYLRMAPTLGGRPGELCALQRSDLDDSEHMVKVWKGANKHVLRVTAVKRSSSVRSLYVGAEFFEEIMPIVQGLEPDEFLFAATGKRLGIRRIPCWTANGVRSRLIRACDRVGVPRYTPHSLRHYCATHLLDQGWPPMQVAKWLGHENDTMVRLLYAAHIVEDTRTQMGEAAARLVPRRLLPNGELRFGNGGGEDHAD